MFGDRHLGDTLFGDTLMADCGKARQWSGVAFTPGGNLTAAAVQCSTHCVFHGTRNLLQS